jgi:acyl-CoA-binding protein
MLKALSPDTVGRLATPKCVVHALDDHCVGLQEADWSSGGQLVHDQVPETRFTDIALVLILMQGKDGLLRSAIEHSQQTALPIHWYHLYYSVRGSTLACFQAITVLGCDFFLQGVPNRSPELCQKTDKKVKAYDSRMEKFCEVELSQMPSDWKDWFVTWWTQKIAAENLIAPEDDDVVEDMPLGLEVVTQLHALLQGTKGGSESLSLQEQFQMCSENVKHVTNITDEQKLGLYGLYKQATVGHCNTASPGFFDFVGKAKWKAWDALGNMSQETAMEKYVQMAKSLMQS